MEKIYIKPIDVHVQPSRPHYESISKNHGKNRLNKQYWKPWKHRVIVKQIRPFCQTFNGLDKFDWIFRLFYNFFSVSFGLYSWFSILKIDLILKCPFRARWVMEQYQKPSTINAQFHFACWIFIQIDFSGGNALTHRNNGSSATDCIVRKNIYFIFFHFGHLDLFKCIYVSIFGCIWMRCVFCALWFLMHGKMARANQSKVWGVKERWWIKFISFCC